MTENNSSRFFLDAWYYSRGSVFEEYSEKWPVNLASMTGDLVSNGGMGVESGGGDRGLEPPIEKSAGTSPQKF